MVKEAFSRDGLKVIGKLSGLFLFVAMFWALYDQTGAAWVLQAEKMDRRLLRAEWERIPGRQGGPGSVDQSAADHAADPRVHLRRSIRPSIA